MSTDTMSPCSTVTSEIKVWTIQEWLTQTRQWLETHYHYFWLQGEVSNFTQASSGHIYFVLKDNQAQIRCVFFRMYAQRCKLNLRNGLKIEVFVQATLYEERGDLQLRVEQIREVGLGNLWQQFLALKAKLDALGWFAQEHKRPLPSHPKRIGIITSAQAAALRDVITTLRHRAPSITLILYPTAVQGEHAPAQIAQSIKTACLRAEVDVLILCRGGGSLEDLAAFNSEPVALALFEATLPVISGIGHETDFTIADFVADVRAPTPTGAAVMAAPDERATLQRLRVFSQRLLHHMRHRLEREQIRLDHLSQQLRSPHERLTIHRQHLQHLMQRWQLILLRTVTSYYPVLSLRLHRLQSAKRLPSPELIQRRFEQLRNTQLSYLQHLKLTLSQLQTRLQAVYPMASLNRGYAILSTPPPAQTIITSIKGLAAGQPLQVLLQDGVVHVTIDSLTSANAEKRTTD